jgi:hypothetical protein
VGILKMARPPSLREGERVLASLVANHIQGGRPIDGRLYLTSQRLMFMPQGAGMLELYVVWRPVKAARQVDEARHSSTERAG